MDLNYRYCQGGRQGDREREREREREECTGGRVV